MNQYVIFFRLPTKVYLGEQSDREHDRRISEILCLLFSLGPAYHASQGGVLLHTDLSHSQLVERISPMVESGDFVGIVEVSAKAVTAMGYDWEPDDLDALYPNVARFDGLDRAT
jgi:hypothetical protein